MDFPFGPLAPDQGEDTPGAMMVADGVIPLQEGYGPQKALSVSDSAAALSAAPRGLISYQKADGTWSTAAATATTVELKASNDTWSSIDSGLLLTAGDDRCMLRFGTKLLYTDTTQGLRAFDVEAGGSALAIAAAGNPRWMFECGNLLFNLDCLDSAGNRNNRLIKSSAISDHTNYTTKGADYQPLEGGGALIWGGKLTDTSALVLQQRAVKLINVGNAGGGALWGQQTISEEFGSVGAKSCASFDGKAFWVATDGFRMYDPGASGKPVSIGAGFVDNWFLGRVDSTNLSSIQGSYDPFRKCMLWRYNGPNAISSTVFGDIIGYHWVFKRWFTLTVQSTYLGYTATPGATWDAFSGTWDPATVTWDDRALQGGQPLFGALDASFKYGNFSGSNLAATLETAIGNSPASELITSATPIDDSADGTLQLGVKDALSGTTTWKTGESKKTSGRAPVRGRGKNIGMRRNITAASAWTYAKGVDHIAGASGGPK